MFSPPCTKQDLTFWTDDDDPKTIFTETMSPVKIWLIRAVCLFVCHNLRSHGGSIHSCADNPHQITLVADLNFFNFIQI